MVAAATKIAILLWETVLLCITVETSHNHSEYLPFNACFLSPCQNDATCIPMDKHFACTCLPGYTGSYCEKRIDECALLPCGLNATCVLHETSGYTCLCPPGLRGQNCDEDVNECALSSCLNGATCVNIFGSFQCICPDGYTGKYAFVVSFRGCLHALLKIPHPFVAFLIA